MWGEGEKASGRPHQRPWENRQTQHEGFLQTQNPFDQDSQWTAAQFTKAPFSAQPTNQNLQSEETQQRKI